VENAAARDSVEILLIESDIVEARVIEKSLRDGPNQSRINHVRAGVQALAFLRREGAYREAPKLDLILVDLNLTRVDGGELLAEIQRDPDLRRIPVVVLTDAATAKHAVEAANGLADCMIVRPMDAEKFARTIRALAEHGGASAMRPATAAGFDAQRLDDLAHQLRTHLNPIIAFSEIMKLEIRGPLNGDYHEYARGIHQSALALSRIVFDLLDRAQNGRSPRL